MANSASASLRAACHALDNGLRKAARKSQATYRSTGAELRSLAGRLRHVDARSALKIGAVAAAVGTGLVVLHGDEKEEYAVPPRKGTAEDAKRVNKWWDSLSSAEQEELLDKEPERIGNLNGIPVAVRSEANKRVMNADIQRVERIADAKGVSAEVIERDPEKYGLTADDITRYHNAKNVRAGLQAYEGPDQADDGKYPPAPYKTYLYAYQPLAFGGKGRAAISIGDPDTASNTAVVVPGASQSVRASDASDKGYFDVQRDQALNLYTQSNRADPDNPTAVVAWMGYDDPADGLKAVLDGDPTAERKGGNLLAEDVDGLRATHQGPRSHLTAVGYSAGAMVVSDAAAASRLQADDVVLLGPINADEARNVSDFHMGDRGNVYVGEASNDLNAHGGHLISNLVSGGSDPLDPDFGATRIKAEAPDTAPYSSPIGYSGQAHLHYFTAGSESLYSTALITSGNADRLGQEGMKADQIDERPFWPDDDPEADRSGVRDDHYHSPE
ncbi:alpha/beta hydrolase [Nocardia australiensis]|uniref:alpha/beta hydrolase n=1 Tax=Nocardia australiensis TaxID=2887191 RepID=UPI001D141C6E|nr:alpha/beta hydrolase [Nocardia australiensis]